MIDRTWRPVQGRSISRSPLIQCLNALDAVGDAENREQAARRQNEAMRELLVFIRDHVDLPDEIAQLAEQLPIAVRMAG